MTKKPTKSRVNNLNRAKTSRTSRIKRTTRTRRVATARRRRDLGFNSAGALSLAFFKGKSQDSRTVKIVGLVIFAILFAFVGIRLLTGSHAENKDNYLLDASGTPAVVDSNDPKGVELGVKFRSSVDGYIRGVRFYKAVNNTGVHTGTLWTASGTKLATGTFYTNDTASGWQSLKFNGVKITANTTYIVSYYAPNGHYSASYNFFTKDLVRGSLTAPASTATSGNGVYKYGAASAFPTDTGNGNNYWVDPIFNRDFSTFAALLSGTPASTSTDTRPVELGTRFITDKPGKLASIAFYQASTDRSTTKHTASLWKADGTKLGSVAFTTDTTGWNKVNFATPVALAANTEYIVSVYCPSGKYTYTTDGLAAPIDKSPLHSPANAGAYMYAGAPTFPKNTSPTNYFIQPTVGYGDSTTTTTPPPPPPPSSGAPTPGPMPYTVTGSRTIYVSPSGDDSDGSSWAKAYKQVSRAAAVATAGTIVRVGNGVYDAGIIYVRGKSGLSSSAPITFISDTKWGAKVQASGQPRIWEINNDYVRVINFDISNATTTGILSTASYGKFLGNRIHDLYTSVCGGGAGIELQNYSGSYNDSIGNVIDHIIVTGSEAETCAKNHGIYYQGPNGGNILNNVVTDTSGWGIHLYHNPTNTIVAYNTVLRNKRGGIVIGAARESGDVAGSYATGMKVYNNIIAYNPDSPLREAGVYVGGNTYNNNLLWGNSNGNFNFRGDSTSTRANNIEDADPMFVNKDSDYRLRTGSRAINGAAAIPGFSMVPYDLIYVPRPLPAGGAYDIGAYEGGY